jgi:hypothetical protein
LAHPTSKPEQIRSSRRRAQPPLHLIRYKIHFRRTTRVFALAEKHALTEHGAEFIDEQREAAAGDSRPLQCCTAESKR